jgi:hypothetical protein
MQSEGLEKIKRRKLSGCVAMCVGAALVVSVSVAIGQAADPFAPAEFTVTENVAWNDIEPIGANMTLITGGTNFATNNFIWGSGMEPAVGRYLIRVERFGPDWMEWDQSFGGVHMWLQNATGFGDGATVRIYRIVDENGQPLSYANGTDLSDATGADHVVFLGETVVPQGGWIAEGDEPGDQNRVYIEDGSIDLAFGDHVLFTVTKRKITAEEVDPRLHQWFEPEVNILGVPENGTADLVDHPGSIPPAFAEPGDTCLQLGTTDGAPAYFGQYIFHGFDQEEGQWYSQLEPGAPYRVEVWLRQEGVPNGAVRFMAVGPYSNLTQSTPWQVTGEWQLCTYDFTGPPYPSPLDWHAGLGVEVSGPGTVWLDNFVVYRNDAEHGFRPFTPHKFAFDELMDALPPSGPKPAIRWYTTTYPGHSPMERLLSNYASSSIDFIYNVVARGPDGAQTVTIPQVLEWCLATGSVAQDRIIPYFTLSEEYTEVEWVELMEYLGVPYDPEVDTPASKPWAYRRYQQRGNGTPWTDEFREIIIELGNETWHAGVLAGWHGFGRPGWVGFGGTEYGLFARHFFTEHVAAHPWWTQYNLESKIRFCLNANYAADPTWAYGELAAQAAPEATDYVGHANYVGPKWETGEEPFQSFDDHGMQETLVGGYLDMFPLIAEVEAVRAQLQSQGLADYRVIAYEGGPSGYYLPGSGEPQQVENSELYGKSVGMAVSALDAWLYSSLNGYLHQCMYGYASGGYWTSHTMPRDGGFRRHTGWLAMMLRNRYALGSEILDVTELGVPTYEREGEDVPLTSAYAIRGEASLSVFVLSRKLDGEHDGVNFGDGTTPVTVHLPFTECAAVTRYALTAPDGSPVDPRVNNREQENVVISSVDLDPSIIATGDLTIGPDSGGVAGGMPPGTVYLYVFDLAIPPDGDIDDDGDADLEDYALFALCLSGYEPPDPTVCGAADLDADGQTTLADYPILADCLNGPDAPPACE